MNFVRDGWGRVGTAVGADEFAQNACEAGAGAASFASMKIRSSGLLMLATLAPAVGCNRDDDKMKTSDGSGGAWAVGEDATMIRVDGHGEVSFYPLESEGDLLAIACKGKQMAVAVGEDGVVLRTEN